MRLGKLNHHKLATRKILLALILLSIGNTFATDSDEVLRKRVSSVLKETPLIDGHNDLPMEYTNRVKGNLDQMPFTSDLSAIERPTHTDYPRMVKGMIGGQFWSVYIPITAYPGASGDVGRVLKQIDVVHRMITTYPDQLELALTANEIISAHHRGKIASLMGIEGGHSIENSLANLRMLYRTGARYMTLTHSKGLRWADSATDEERVGGLSPFGKEVVREMNRLGMLVDLSHVSVSAMNDALDVSTAPVIFSHSSAYALTAHKRNIPDEVLLRLQANNGVAMVTFFPSYVSETVRLSWIRLREMVNAQTEDPKEQTKLYRAQLLTLPRPTLADVADHIDHIRNLIGIDHIGLGGDYDGMPPGPIGLEDVSTYPALLTELLRRGYSDADIAKIAGGNILRVMQAVEIVARTEQARRLPSNAQIEELDDLPPASAGEL
ncbi:MAG: dipeptidase [Rhodospirillaceae bacterium]|nr:dipeptidase [Rhodospirillaceae bacterium]